MGTTARVTEADCKVHAVVAKNVSGQQIDEEE